MKRIFLPLLVWLAGCEGGLAVGQLSQAQPILRFTVDGSVTPSVIGFQTYVELKVALEAGSGISSVEFYDGSVLLATVRDSSPFFPLTYWWVDSAHNGTHVLTARGLDGGGMVVDESNPVTVTIDVPGGKLLGSQYLGRWWIESLRHRRYSLVAAGTTYGDPTNTDGFVDFHLGSTVEKVIWDPLIPGTGFHDVRLNSYDDIIVAGYAVIGGQKDVLLRIARDAGNLPSYTMNSWSAIHFNAAGLDDEAHAVAVNDHDDLFVAGYETRPQSRRNIWVTAYDRNGTTRWNDTVDSAGSGYFASGDDVANAADCDGNDLIVAGVITTHRWRRSGTYFFPVDDQDLWVRRYTSDGTVLWTRTLTGPALLDDGALAVAADPRGTGDVYVCGFQRVAADEAEMVIVKYNRAGDQVWSVTSHPSRQRVAPSTFIGGFDQATSCAMDGHGNLFVHGTSDSYNMVGARTALTQRWSSDGKMLWQSTEPNTWYGRGISIDPTGYVVVASRTNGDSVASFTYIP